MTRNLAVVRRRGWCYSNSNFCFVLFYFWLIEFSFVCCFMWKFIKYLLFLFFRNEYLIKSISFYFHMKNGLFFFFFLYFHYCNLTFFVCLYIYLFYIDYKNKSSGFIAWKMKEKKRKYGKTTFNLFFFFEIRNQ